MIDGAVRSILIPLTVAEPSFPALSRTWTGPAVRFDPSPVTRLSPGTVLGSTPDRESEAVQWTTTSSLNQPFPFGVETIAPDTLGAVVSMLMWSMVALAALPAVSCAVPWADWFAPWLLTIVSGEQSLIPERASAQVKSTVTGLLFQP